MAVSDYSTTPDLNTTISGINIAEGCAPSGINNAIRQLMADVKAESNAKNSAITAAQSAAISAAAADATSKANAAQSAAISAAATDATRKADAAKSSAISTAASDATSKADAAQAAAEATAATALSSAVSTLNSKNNSQDSAIAAAQSTANAALPKSGGDVTGQLRVKSNNLDLTATPTSIVYGNWFKLTDKNDLPAFQIRGVKNTNGTNSVEFALADNTGVTRYPMTLSIGEGTESAVLDLKKGMRLALGGNAVLTSSKIFYSAATTGTITLPAGGTWVYCQFGTRVTLDGAMERTSVLTAAGGTVLSVPETCISHSVFAVQIA